MSEISTNPPIAVGYEFLDHTADVQIHSWGSTLKEAFEQAAMGIFGYMTLSSSLAVDEAIALIDLSKGSVGDRKEALVSTTINAQGSDLIDLFFHFLDEVLFLYAGPLHMALKRISITNMSAEHDQDSDLSVEAACYGEPWCNERHAHGTEIKAITFSNMQILSSESRYDCYVIVDI
jgi:SHS2 domain-containing protein